MNQSRLTINVQVSYVADWGKTLNFLRQLNPVAVVACVDNMNDKNRIDELAATLPDTTIIGRFVFKGDGGMHLKPQAPGDNREYIVSPDDALNAWGSLGTGKNCTLYMYNEPQVTLATDMTITRLVTHTLETIDKATTRGISLVIGNFGAGHYLTPAFDDVLRKLSQLRDEHALGIHLYAPIDTLTALTMITSRCTTLGIKPPRIHVTEYGYDSANPTDKLNGYKSRGYTGLQFSTWERVGISNVYKYYFVDDVLQSVATFTWGNDASWHNFNVEMDQEWQDDILDAARHGVLTVDKSPIVQPLPPTPIPPLPPLKQLTAADVAAWTVMRRNLVVEMDNNTNANLRLADTIALIDRMMLVAK